MTHSNESKSVTERVICVGSVIFLVTLFIFGAGIYVAHFNWFPYPQLINTSSKLSANASGGNRVDDAHTGWITSAEKLPRAISKEFGL